MTKKKAKKGGSKGKYKKWLEPEGLILLEGWARDGLTDEQIAKNMGIVRSTLAKWKNEYSDISDTLKKGKEVSDYEVQNAMHKKATGYYVPEQQAYKCKRVFYDDSGRRCEKEELKTIDVLKYIPPDSTMQIYWSKNRMPDKWRDKVEQTVKVEHKGNELLEAIKKAGGLFSDKELNREDEK